MVGSSASGGTLFVEPREATEHGNRLKLRLAAVEREEERVLAELSRLVASFADAVDGALAAAVPGFIDYLALRKRAAMRLAAVHMGLNLALVVLAAIFFLALATVGVAYMSEILVHAVEPVTAQLGISEAFLGLIVIPVIGNAAVNIVWGRSG